MRSVRVCCDIYNRNLRVEYVMCDQVGVLWSLVWRETSLAIVVTEQLCSRCTSLEGLGGSKS